MLDVFGPAEVFIDANRLHGGQPAYEVEIISAAEDQTVASHIGTPLLADRTYRELAVPSTRFLSPVATILARCGIRRVLWAGSENGAQTSVV
jgi:hypothetical protein